jgi:hypothetical protein
MSVISKGASIKCSNSSRNHYLRGKENKQINVLQVYGFVTTDPDEAIEMIQLSAKGTRCKKPGYSVKLSPETDRVWTKKELRKVIDKLEKNLKLEGHPRVVIEHLKKGRLHYHIIWDRRPPDGGPFCVMRNDYSIHLQTQGEIEKDLKLRPMIARGRNFKLWEIQWSKRCGFDIFQMREQITSDFNRSTSGQLFKSDLLSKGVVLCRGDKSQFLIVLPWGQHKALSSMVHGRPTRAKIQKRLADISTALLPHVLDAKVSVKESLLIAKLAATAPKPHIAIKAVAVSSASLSPRQNSGWSNSISTIIEEAPRVQRFTEEPKEQQIRSPVFYKEAQRPVQENNALAGTRTSISGLLKSINDEANAACDGIDQDYAGRVSNAKLMKDYGLARQLEKERDGFKQHLRERAATEITCVINIQKREVAELELQRKERHPRRQYNFRPRPALRGPSF